ncbi:hypothetical protein W97_00837 [Coniosporium apollinis CBS 100218]|uniref:BTB domain-containing protein n=1 Tax=Coniosporium apollinis (strain CBS 100218) TaxID=1168221 RepID=R7YI94_CONA1|nr:uncharacterized protein W97_00837 [Coniosporium apollinis CBS 100218]EON61622.1 hypothetical protein W97_00837 [Coniosporium apollinis CBS 100218]
MGDKPREELMCSMRELFTDDTYSDLTITCGRDQHRVHKAIVCPRSKFFAAACNGVFKEARTAKIPLPHDDAQAVRLMVHYLYHLDYPHVSLYSEDDDRGDGTAEEVEAGTANVDAGDEYNQEEAAPAQEAPPSEEVLQVEEALSEAAEPPSPPPPQLEPQRIDVIYAPWDSSGSTKKMKKRKKKSSFWYEGPRAEPERMLLQESDEGPSRAAYAQRAWNDPPQATEDAPEEPVPADLDATQPLIQSPNLIIHAKVYALAEKYNITALKALALEKFAVEAGTFWNSTEFSQAAYEAYTSTIESDRGLRDVVVGTLYQHPEMLSKKDVQDVVRDLNLAYDLLMYVREKRRW